MRKVLPISEFSKHKYKILKDFYTYTLFYSCHLLHFVLYVVLGEPNPFARTRGKLHNVNSILISDSHVQNDQTIIVPWNPHQNNCSADKPQIQIYFILLNHKLWCISSKTGGREATMGHFLYPSPHLYYIG